VSVLFSIWSHETWVEADGLTAFTKAQLLDTATDQKPDEGESVLGMDEKIIQQIHSGSRRLNSRVESGDSVWVYWECNGDHDLSPVLDVSVAGLFIKTFKTKRLGAKTNLHFLVQEGQIRAEAVVRHVRPGGGLGLKLHAVSEKDRPNLTALVRRLWSLSGRTS